MNNTIGQLLEWANKELVSIDTHQLDAMILLEKAANISRAKMLTHPEFEVLPPQVNIFKEYIARRKKEEPLAYIVGYKEFWTLEFFVTKDVLIPRPETEVLIETLLQKLPQEGIKVLELGTGSGAIALSLAHERQKWEIIATDISFKALKVAKQNAINNNILNVKFVEGSWYEPVADQKFDVIVSNPPYIAADDPNLEQAVVKFEPTHALIAPQSGLKYIEHIIMDADKHLTQNGLLAIEHGFKQGEDIRKLLLDQSFQNIETFKDLSGNDRVTIGYTLCD